MPDTSQGISVGDAVLTFLADTSQLDSALNQTQQKVESWGQGVDKYTQSASLGFKNVREAELALADAQEQLGESAARGNAQAIAILQQYRQAADELRNSTSPAMQEFGKGTDEVTTRATHGFGSLRAQLGLLDNMMRGNLNYAMADIVRSLIQFDFVANSLKFAAIGAGLGLAIELGIKLVGVFEEIANHGKEVDAAWQKVQDGADAAFNKTGDDILRVGAEIDHLNGDKLAALQKNLELIDHSSLADLSKQIQQIAKDTDDAFTKTKAWWDWVTTLGQGNAAIDAAKKDFDDLTQKLQNIQKFGSENPDPFSTLKTSLDGAKQKVVELEAQQKEAHGEQAGVIQQEIDGNNKNIEALNLLSGAVDKANSDLSDLKRKRAAAQEEFNQAAQQGSAMLTQASAQELAAADKAIDLKQKEITALGHYVNLQLQSLKLEQDRVTLAIDQSNKKDKTDPAAEAEKRAQALLDAQKILGDAIFALIKSQDTEQIDEEEQHYSLLNAATKEGFVEQLNLITTAELEKRAIQQKAEDDAYQFQLNSLQAKLDLLKKSGKDTEDEQTKVNAQIEALHFKHQATLIESYNKMRETLRQSLSQPIPLINEVPEGLDQIENAVTKGFEQASDAAQALGITLHNDLNSGVQSAYDAYAKLLDLQKQGIVTQHDVDNGYEQLLHTQLNFAIQTGASAEAVRKLEAELRALYQTELDQAKADHASIQAIQQIEDKITQLDGKINTFGRRSHITWQDFVHDLHAAHDGAVQAGIGFQNMAAMGEAAFDGLAQGMENAFAQAIMGQKSLGQAMAEAAAQVISSLAAQAIVKAIFYTAEGLAALAAAFFGDPGAAAAAGQYFAAAGEMAAIGGAAAAVGHALAGEASTGSSSSTQPKGTAAPAAGSAVTSAQPQPVQVVNVQHLATGGVTSGMMPTFAMIGDAEHGGAAKEAVLPLENPRAMEAIAQALVPALLAALTSKAPANQDTAYPSVPSFSVPRFFDGAVVSSPTFAMFGDDRGGGPATEGVLPLDNSLAMEKIARAIVRSLPAESGVIAGRADLPLVNIPAPVIHVSAPLLSPATLAAAAPAGSGIAHSGGAPDLSSIEKAANAILQLARTPQQHKVSVGLEVKTDVHSFVKEINQKVKSGNIHLEASNSARLTRKS